MKKYILVAIVLLYFSSSFAFARNWPLKINATPDWEVQYKGDGVDFFQLLRPHGENVFFIFSKWPAPGGKEQISEFVQKIAEGIVGKEQRKVDESPKRNYQIEEIKGEEFSGQAAVFRKAFGIFNVVFMVSDGDGIWNGQFSGSESMWGKAKTILESLERNSI